MTVEEVERKYGQKVVAIVKADDGSILDCCFNWESGQNYALSSGVQVEAIADDVGLTREDAQRLYDVERERYIDCFGKAE